MKPLDFFIRQLEKTAIFEMALSRNRMKNRTDNLLIRLLEHWMLVRYCIRYDFGNANKNHWLKEARSYMITIQSWKTKGYDKLKVVREVFNENEVTDNPYTRFVRWKFGDEHIDLTDNQIEELEHDWAEQLPVLIKVLGSDYDIDGYIDEHLLKVNR